jgi:hypothetical protein
MTNGSLDIGQIFEKNFKYHGSRLHEPYQLQASVISNIMVHVFTNHANYGLPLSAHPTLFLFGVVEMNYFPFVIYFTKNIGNTC